MNVLDYFGKLLSARAYTEKELIEKAKAKDYDKDEIQEAINHLLDKNYINDEDYAAKYVKDAYSLKGYGAYRITMELSKKGISSESARNAIKDFGVNEKDILLEKIEKKFAEPENQKEKDKIVRYFASRGFNASDIYWAIKETFHD